MRRLGGWVRRARRHALVFAVLATFTAASPARAATTYYVRASGDDRNNGLTPQTALATIRSAGRLLVRPGDTVVVGPGTYHEGNIQPRKSGRPSAPIGFFADTSGHQTDDPPGAVVILPPNAPDSTTGFIVYGRHDIHIEGFEIDGAKDAAIQVRPRPRTGLDSSQITLVNNSARRGHKGIQVTAMGDVSVIGNRLTDNDIGLWLFSGTNGALRPVVTSNIIDQDHGSAIRCNQTSGGAITQNMLTERDPNYFSLNLGHTDGMAITGNQIVSGHARMWGNDIEVTDNVFGAGAGMAANAGRLLFARNQMPGGQEFSLLIRGGAQVTVLENSIPRFYIGAAQLDLERNAIASIEATVGAMTAADNQFLGGVKLKDGSSLEARGNRGGNFIAYAGARLLVQDNNFTGQVTLRGNNGTIQANRFGALSLTGPAGVIEPSGPLVVTGNVTGGSVGIRGGPAPVTVENNVCAGMLRVNAQNAMDVRGNEAHGISCLLFTPDSRAVLAENKAHSSAADGLAVIGAGDAVIENNLSSDNAGGGLVVRRVTNLVVADNNVHQNAGGGISVRAALACDCNGDMHVTVNELIVAIGIALEQRPLHECDAADVDGDGAVTIHDIVFGVQAALTPTEPRDRSVEINANRVEGNGRFGIDLFALGAITASGNQVVQNAGIPLAIYGGGVVDRLAVTDNVLGDGSEQGLLLDGVAQASVRNNVVFSNREAGILLRDAPNASVVNNLVYANRNDGIAVGLGSGLPTANAVLMNNTVYGNAGWGIAIGNALAPSTGASILDNILQHNARGGIAASVDSLLGLTVGFNLNDDRTGDGVEPAASDISADPQFVLPAGVDGILGGTGFADDDFHLQPTSRAIDAGSGLAAALGITGSAVAGQTSDQGIVDLGYHYGASP